MSKIIIDSGKFDYIFGKVASNTHNIARSHQLVTQMKSLGVFNDLAGRELLIEFFESMVLTSDNIINKFSKNTQTFEIRQALFAGPSGKFGVFEATFEVMLNNKNRFVTLIIKGVN